MYMIKGFSYQYAIVQTVFTTRIEKNAHETTTLHPPNFIVL